VKDAKLVQKSSCNVLRIYEISKEKGQKIWVGCSQGDLRGSLESYPAPEREAQRNVSTPF
jgi:ligand-binding sensor domain-containing protein